MLKLFLISFGLLAACEVSADTPPTPQPLAPSTQDKDAGSKMGSPRRLPAPTVSVTRATRQADGSLSIDCVQRPNPKLRMPPATPHADGAQP